MKLRILHTADLHIGYNGGIPVEKWCEEAGEKIPIRILDTFDRLDYMMKFAIKKKIDIFIIAGDIFERPSVKNIYQHMFAKRIGDLMHHGIHVVVATGNHDTDGKTSALSAVAELTDGHKLLHIVEKKKLIRTEKADIYCIPYYVGIEDRIQKDIEIVMEKRDFSKTMIGVSHIGVSGCKVGKLQTPLQTNVGAENLRGFGYLALGDFHINQKIGDGTRIGKGSEIWYSGSPLRLNMGEPEKKYFNYAFFRDHKQLMMPVVKKIHLEDREFVSQKIMWADLVNIYKQYKAGEKLRAFPKGSIVKLTVQATKNRVVSSKLPKLVEKMMEKLGVLHFDLVWDYINVQKNKRVNTKGKTIGKAVDGYIEKHPPKKVAKEKAKISAKEILKNARKKRSG